MLLHLAIIDFVIVRSLTLELTPGFCALTGETGVGKSVLLRALEAALGGRIDRSAIRAGAEYAELIAVFAPEQASINLLSEHGIESDETLILRRQIRRSGAGRAWINDRPVGVGLLRELGEHLVEMHGQRAGAILLSPAGQLSMLDAFAQAGPERARCAASWTALQQAEARIGELAASQARSETERDFLQLALDELQELSPQPGEASLLASERKILQQGEQIGTAVIEAHNALSGEDGSAYEYLARAARALQFPGATDSDSMAETRQAIERALTETEEAMRAIAAMDNDFGPERLEAVETRLFGLRALGRKHDFDPDCLPELQEQLQARLIALDDGAAELAAAERCGEAARQAYETAAEQLSKTRHQAAEALMAAMMREMEPLRLNKMRFRVQHIIDPERSGINGRDRIIFEIAPGPDDEFAPLHRIASGGESSRLFLALRVCMAHMDGATTLIFDEVDTGIGGATAAAVGERMARLGQGRQVLAVTHSPQMAAAAAAQWRIVRNGAEPDIIRLDTEGRQEEIARMLAGSGVTNEARAAAVRLLAGK